jgi:serine phosphatase RsbU (regulator of sigma subunit)
VNRNYFTYLIIFLLFFFGASAQNSVPKLEAEKGVKDARNFDFENNRFLYLNGEWEFYPNEFVMPGEQPQTKPEYIQVPELWSKSGINEIASGLGYGTYRLTVKIPETEKILSLRIRRIETAYKLFFNDSLVAQVGKPGDSRKNMEPGKENRFIYLPADGQDFVLTFHVSNFYHRKAGIISRIEMGRPAKVLRSVWRARGYEMLLLGAILIMAFYHLSLFVLRKEDKASLYFALFLIVVQLHMTVNGEVFLTKLFERLNWELLLKIDFITNYLTIAFFFLFFRSLNPKMYKRYAVILIVGTSIVLTTITLFTKALFFTNLLIVFEVTGLAAGLYVLAVLVISIIQGRKKAVYPLLGTLLIIIAGINDVLHEQMLIHTFYALPMGIVGFIFFQSHILNLNFTRMVSQTNDINRMTAKLDALKSKFLGKSIFDFSYPLEVIAEEFSADYALIFEYEKEALKPAAIYPQKFSEVGASINSQKKALAVIKSGQPEAAAPDKALNGRCALTFPFKDEDKTVYVLYLERRPLFGNEDIRILDLLTEQIIGLAENFRLYNELKDLNSRLEEIIQERTREVREQREDLEQQRDEIEQQSENLNRIFKEIRNKNKAITADIKYAKKIHSALFRSWGTISEILPEHFILFRPKEIIGGDFYWAESIGDERIFCAADCTGHGVPGALMSIIGQNLLNRAVHELQLTKPSEILDSLQDGIRKVLSQYEGSKSKDGMDLSLINYNSATRKLMFAGARNSAYLVRNDEITEIKADKMSIGGIVHARISKDRRFKNTEIELQKNDMLYMMSDGYIDQIGGNRHRKFMRKRMKTVFLDLAAKPVDIQKQTLEHLFDDWRDDIQQMDDVLVTGIKF